MSNGEIHIYLNNDVTFSTNWLDLTTWWSAWGLGEDPASKETTFGHELSHAISLGGASENAITNYWENFIRAGRSETLRSSYSGTTLTDEPPESFFAVVIFPETWIFNNGRILLRRGDIVPYWAIELGILYTAEPGLVIKDMDGYLMCDYPP